MNTETMASSGVDATKPQIRQVAVSEIREILAKGYSDFSAHPTHRVFLSLMFPFIGFVLIRYTLGHDLWPMVFPLVAGFALIGPFAAIGMYGLSRRHEHFPAVTWRGTMDAFRSTSFPSITALGLVLLVIFMAWLFTAQFIYDVTFGSVETTSMSDFITKLLSTREGWALIVFGNGAGLIFAAVVLSISVVSFPMLIDRQVGFRTAVLTSVRAVAANPATMTVWGIVVGVTLILGALPFLVGLAFVFPLLGHATWHLYRKTVQN